MLDIKHIFTFSLSSEIQIAFHCFDSGPHCMTYCETSILHFRVNIIWNFTLVKDLNVRWWMPYFKKRGLWMSTQSLNEIHFLLFIWRRKSKCAAILKLVMHCWHSFVIFLHGRPPICTADSCEAANLMSKICLFEQQTKKNEWKPKTFKCC